MKKIGIIGVGSLGTHLTKLICRNNLQSFLTVSDRNVEKLIKVNDLNNTDGVSLAYNMDNILASDIIFLTVKPDNIKSVCNDIKHTMKISWNHSWTPKKTIVSAAAGVPAFKIRRWLGGDYNIVRFMPNIPISVGSGSIVWYSEDIHTHDEIRRVLDDISEGPTSLWVNDEELIDAATIIFGSSPAYIAYFYKIYVEMGIEMGFTEDECCTMLSQVFAGTSELLNNFDSDSIIDQVASKGGATEKGLEMLDDNLFSDIIRNSLFSSLEQIKKITKKLD